MMTRSGARVYRGQGPQRAASDACPTCHKPVKLTSTGRRGTHKDPDGGDCAGSGVMVGDGRPAEVDPDAACDAWAKGNAEWGSLPDRDVTATGRTRQWSTPRRWSGKP